MFVNLSNSNISFKKQLIANTSLLSKKEGVVPCSVYKLEDDIDKNYFFTINNYKEWDNAEYFDFMAYSLSRLNILREKNKKFFVIENNNQDCLGYAQVSEEGSGYLLDVLEVVPKYSSTFLKEKSSAIKYVGQTLVSFIAKLAQKTKKDFLGVDATTFTRTYYSDVCFFDEDNLILYSKNFPDLIKQNEENIKSKIEFVI